MDIRIFNVSLLVGWLLVLAGGVIIHPGWGLAIAGGVLLVFTPIVAYLAGINRPAAPQQQQRAAGARSETA